MTNAAATARSECREPRMARIAIAQIDMHWSTAENVAAIVRAMHLARSRGAELCEESVEGGESTVASPAGEVLFRLPRQESGVAVFNLGATTFEWHRQ
jgi:predicted amidohydrolase